MALRIPLLVPDMPSAADILPWLQRIDESRWYTNYGPLNAEFERQVSTLLDSGGNVSLTTVANCTVGLELALSGLELEPGARVLMPSLTFVATATAAIRAGLTPLIADVDADSWLLTPEIARLALEREPFAAVVPVSTFGVPQAEAGWDRFTSETGIPVVIDAAGALGNQQVGETSVVVFSLHATKPLGIGEGGLVAGRSADVIAHVRRATNFGIDLQSPVGNALPGGTNAKLSEYHAAVGLAAIPRWQRSRAVRRTLYDEYRRVLTEQFGSRVRFQTGPADRVHSLLALRISGCADTRGLADRLMAAGIGARRWYLPLLSDHTAFRCCPIVGELTNSRDLADELIGLPFYPALRIEQVHEVAAALALALDEK